MSNAGPAFVPIGGTYYRHSGKFSPSGLAIALIAGSTAGILLGAIYAYIDLYNPIAGWITFIVIGGIGFAMGAVLSALLKSGKIRNVAIGMMVALLATTVMYITTWEVWLFAFLQRHNAGVTLFDIVFHPAAAWDLITRINANGAWSMDGNTPTGIFLTLLWLVEAAILMIIPLAMARSALTAAPFCEKCEKWCPTRPLANLKPGEKGDLRRKLEAKDFTALTALGAASAGARQYWQVFFQGCANCDTTQTLCVSDVVITQDKKGNLKTTTAPLVRRLLLTPDDTVAAATAIAALNEPEVVADAVEPANQPIEVAAGPDASTTTDAVTPAETTTPPA